MLHSEFHWQQSDDRCVIDAPGGQLAFVRAGDRWTHELAFGMGAGAPAIVSTVEADSGPAQSDPARVLSPVYQELQRHEFVGDRFHGICVLLTGRLHQHHFSASVTVYQELEAERLIAVDIDIADRCRAPISSLAATYLVRLNSSELADAGPQAILWSGPDEPEAGGPEWLELRCEPPGSVALAEAGRNATRVQVLADINSRTYTHRLRYRWRWSAV